MFNTVYLVKTEDQPYYKIGKTAGEIKQRMADLQTGCPFKIVYVFHISAIDESAVESCLHSLFRHRKTQGEWFQFDSKDLKTCIQTMQLMQIKTNVVTKDIEGDLTIVPVAEAIKTDSDWYSWLPAKDVIITRLEQTEGSFAGFVKGKLKKTEAMYNRKTKKAIVNMLIQRQRYDLLKKLNIDPAEYGF